MRDDGRIPGWLTLWTTALLLALLASGAWWLGRNDLPDGFQNEYEHLYTLTEAFFRARDEGLAEAWPALWHGYYPPLPHAIASAGMSLLGRSREVATLSLAAVAAALLLFSTARLAQALAGSRVAALAVALLAAWPGIFGNLRRYEPNVLLAALVAVAAAALAGRRRAGRRASPLLLGALCGLGMLADRLVFAVYLAIPLLSAAWRDLRPSPSPGAPSRARALSWWLAAALATLAVCGYFYFHFVRFHLREVTTQVGGEISASGDELQSLPLWRPLGFLYYPLSFIDCQMGPALGTFALLGLVLWFALPARRALATAPHAPAREAAAVLESWLLGGLLLVTFVSKKQPFYSIPLLAPAAVLAAAGWDSALEALRRRARDPVAAVRLNRAAIAAVALLALLALHQFLFLTRGRGLPPWTGAGPLPLLAGVSPLPPRTLGYEYTQAAAPNGQGLQIPEIKRLCSAERSRTGRPYALLFSEGQGAYEGQLMPTLRLALDTRLVEGALMEPESVEDHRHEASCFVYVTEPGGGDWPSADSVEAEYAHFGLAPPRPTLVPALLSLRPHARLLARWTSVLGETVSIFSLDGVPPPASP